MFISYGDNDYTTGIDIKVVYHVVLFNNKTDRVKVLIINLITNQDHLVVHIDLNNSHSREQFCKFLTKMSLVVSH